MSLRRSLVLAAALALGATLAPSVASADAPAAPAPAPATPDLVVLRSGTTLRGTLEEIVPGDHVVIVAEGGERKTIPWADIDHVTSVVSPPGTTPAPPPAPPAAETPKAPETPSAEPPPRYEWRANRPLLVTGAIVFAAGWGPNVAAAAPATVSLVGRVAVFVLTFGLGLLACAFEEGGDDWLCHANHGSIQLLVPIAGPFLFAANHPHDDFLNRSGAQLSGTSKALLYTSAGLQIAGIGSILAALVTGKEELVPGRTKASTSPSFFVAPQAAPGTLGLGVTLTHW